MGTPVIIDAACKITMSGWIEHDELRCVEATSLFIVVGQP